MSHKPAKAKPPTFNPLKTREALKPTKKAASKAKGNAPKKKPPSSLAKVDLTTVELPFEVYHDERSGRYYYQTEDGQWRGYSAEDFKRMLRLHGISGRAEEGFQTSPQDLVIVKVHRCYGIDYAGRLAGHFAGFRKVSGKKLLITSSPDLPEPEPGSIAHLNEFLIGLFGVEMDSHGAKQMLIFCLWIARAWRGIKEGKALLGHALILAGPRGCGKNLLQEIIIHSALGGRSEKAGLYLMGKSEFNAELFGGEHLMLSDENGGRDYRSRREFGQKIKGVVANHMHSMHPKGRDAMTVEPLWRVTISVNDEAEHLQTLPPVGDKDISDKVHLLRMWPADMPHNEDEKEAWLTHIKEEIPAFVHHCLQLEKEVPAAFRETTPRFGHLAFQHPELLEKLNSFAPELHLLSLIDQLMFPPDGDPDEPYQPWEGRASDFRLKLLQLASGRSMLEREISELIKSEAQCGTYLGRLEDHHPERVLQLKREGNKRGWRINPPPSSGAA